MFKELGTKWISRKLGVVGALILAISQIPTPDPLTTCIKIGAYAGLGVAYVIVQGLDDKAKTKAKAEKG